VRKKEKESTCKYISFKQKRIAALFLSFMQKVGVIKKGSLYVIPVLYAKSGCGEKERERERKKGP
jgi:hypothetical protein